MPKKYTIQLDEQDLQVINAALDTHVRQHGVKAVTQVAVFMARVNDQIHAQAEADAVQQAAAPMPLPET